MMNDDAALGKVDEFEADGIDQNVPAMTLREHVTTITDRYS